jgi:hypothetical protein
MHDHTQPLPAPAGRPKRNRSKVVAAVGSLVALGVLSTAIAVSAAAAGPRRDAVAEARHATRKFHSEQAVKDAGYAKFTDVNGITCIDGPKDQGNMGIHFVNGSLIDGTIRADQPEAVLYERTATGLALTAVEYIIKVSDWHGSKAPELFDHPFMLISAPNRFGLPPFYALHAWIWKDNPNGRFNPWNPDVHCTSHAA